MIRTTTKVRTKSVDRNGKPVDYLPHAVITEHITTYYFLWFIPILQTSKVVHYQPR